MNSSVFVGVRRYLAQKRGANMVEYIILVGMVALICVLMFRYFGDAVKDKVAAQKGAVEKINGEAKEE